MAPASWKAERTVFAMSSRADRIELRWLVSIRMTLFGFINVVDLAKAHVVAIRRILEKKQKEKVEVFNIGTGRGLSVLELINAFEKATGVKLNYQIVGRRAGDIVKVWADPKLANEELGWKAEVGIEDTLRSAWNWQLKLRERGIQ